MWQAPNPRARAAVNARKKEREKARNRVHFRRVTGELRIAGSLGSGAKVTPARVVLNDLTSRGLGYYSPTPLTPGQEVSITLEAPKRFYARGRIVGCMELDRGSKVISETPYRYRVMIEFIFDNPAEQDAVRQYCDDLLREFLSNGDRAA